MQLPVAIPAIVAGDFPNDALDTLQSNLVALGGIAVPSPPFSGSGGRFKDIGLSCMVNSCYPRGVPRQASYFVGLRFSLISLFWEAFTAGQRAGTVPCPASRSTE